MRRENHRTRKEQNINTTKILIVSEDKKSFLLYLERILPYNGFGCSTREKKIKNSTNKIYRKKVGDESIEITLRHVQSCPKIIADEAKKEMGKYKKIYCVFDAPSPQSSHRTKFESALNLIRNHSTISAITSSPCYEFWLFLHFSPSTSTKNWSELEKDLNKLISKSLGKAFKYQKNEITTELFEQLLSNQSNAIQRAIAIEKDNNRTNTEIPHTKIYQLIQFLNS